jgi:chromosome segregation ATPase
MEKQPLLEIAEYVSLAGSVLGTVAAVASQQVVYAAAPLTVALSLNLINRRRFPQQIQQDTIGALTETHQVIQSLHQQVQALPSINSKLNALSQEFTARPETQTIEQLETAIAQLTQQWEALTLRLDNLPTASEVNLTGQEQLFADINAQLDALRLRLENLPTTSEIDLTGVVEAIAGQLDALNQQFNARPETQAIEQLETAIAQLAQQQQSVALRLENLPTPLEVDLTGQEQLFADINAQLDALRLRLENLPTASEVDLSGVEQAIASRNGQF